ncbi:MAG: hypothetical protein JJE01_05375 [Gemmatimonadetes bacterium]|nr:hypothetical protein [Gemmatimonadota bacterium]
MRGAGKCRAAALLLITFAAAAHAQEAESQAADDVARELANPNTALASLTFKNQFRWFEGDLPGADEQSAYTLLFQPVFPFPRSDGSKIMFRPAVPFLVGQPVPASETGQFESKTGLGDIAFDLAYAFPPKSSLITAAGIISSIPTATGGLGTKRFTLGPEFLLGVATSKHIALVYPNHQWDIFGSGDADISLTTLQLAYVYLPGGGWNVGSGPILTYDWVVEQWTIPLQVNVGKTVPLGGTAWKLSLEVNYYVEKADAFGPAWMVGFNVTPVLKNYLASFLNDILN